MIKLKSEGFDCVCENITQFKAGSDHRWLILTLLDGEVDCIFTTNGSLSKAKEDVAKYYGFMFGEVDYQCVAYIKH